MLRFLSDEWITAMDDALRGHDALRIATAHTTLRLTTTVTGTDRGPVSYVIVLDRGSNRVRRSPPPLPSSPSRNDVEPIEADVTFTSDWSTATAIASGAESAQAAFMAGRLRLSGDSRMLIDNQGVLRDLGDITGSVRADTDFATSISGQ